MLPATIGIEMSQPDQIWFKKAEAYALMVFRRALSSSFLKQQY